VHVLIRASLPQGARTWILACLTDMHTRLFDSGSNDMQPHHIAALVHEAAAARARARGGVHQRCVLVWAGWRGDRCTIAASSEVRVVGGRSILHAMPSR